MSSVFIFLLGLPVFVSFSFAIDYGLRCSTSFPGGNQVDGLPPASSLRWSGLAACPRVPQTARSEHPDPEKWIRAGADLKKLEIQAQIDLEPAPGRKSSHGIEIESQTTSKTSKIEKMRKSRKTGENLRIHRFFDLQNEFSLCWRSKSNVCAPGSE